jgi:hypothetical protein
MRNGEMRRLRAGRFGTLLEKYSKPVVSDWTAWIKIVTLLR